MTSTQYSPPRCAAKWIGANLPVCCLRSISSRSCRSQPSEAYRGSLPCFSARKLTPHSTKENSCEMSQSVLGDTESSTPLRHKKLNLKPFKGSLLPVRSDSSQLRRRCLGCGCRRWQRGPGVDAPARNCCGFSGRWPSTLLYSESLCSEEG